MDWDTCIGWDSGVQVCAEVFELKDDKAWVIGSDEGSICACQEAVDICPVQAISLGEDESRLQTKRGGQNRKKREDLST